MNNLNKIFKKYSEKDFHFKERKYRLTSNLESSTTDDIVFYKLQSNQKAEDQFKKRLEGANPFVLILCSDTDNENLKIPYLVLEEDSFKKLQEEIVEFTYPAPQNVKLVGITGTNGKSSCVYLCSQISKSLGVLAYSLGTLGLRDSSGVELDSVGLTTPSYLDLRRMIHWVGENNQEAIVFLEVSSHALSQGRLKGLSLVAAGWTNFTQDHLDYHKSLDEYFKAKCLIANYTQEKILFPASVELLKEQFLKEGVKNTTAVEMLPEQYLRDLGKVFRVTYNAENLSLSVALVEAVTKKKVRPENVKNVFLPPGRMNTYEVNSRVFVIDYAHTPDAIRSILEGLKQSFPQNKLTIIFGCGGDRDRAKRPLMREAAEKIADQVIITSDNPRSEDPQAIINDVMMGASKNHLTFINRKEAIESAFAGSLEGEIILVAGKGHEDYQELKTGKVPYSDIAVVEEIKQRDS